MILEKVSSCAERIVLALSVRDMKRPELIEKSGIRKGDLSCYINGRYEPKQPAIAKMAAALDVSELWLSGYDVPMERTSNQKRSDQMEEIIDLLNHNNKFFKRAIKLSGADDDRQRLVEKILEMPDDQFQSIVQLLNVFTKE